MPQSIDGIDLGVPPSHDRAVPFHVTGAVYLARTARCVFLPVVVLHEVLITILRILQIDSGDQSSVPIPIR